MLNLFNAKKMKISDVSNKLEELGNNCFDSIDPNNLYTNFYFENFKSGFNTNKKSNITKFIRVKIKDKTAYDHNSKGSAKLISTAQSDGFMIVEEGISKVVKGRSYPVIKFDI